MPLVSKTFDQLLDFTCTTSGTFVGSNGLIQTTPASTNLLTFTQQFDNAVWTKGAGVTVTANADVAPNGTSTADKLAETATTATHQANTVVTTAATAYTFSCYFKAAERNFAFLYHTQSNAAASVDLTTGAIGQPSGTVAPVSATATDVGNGWWRLAITVNATAASNSFGVYIANTATAVSYAGTAGSGIFIWGAQLELGSTATTYTRNNGGVYPPRFDYDPVTLAPKGILIEEQRVNLVTYSEQFDNAAWTKSDSTVTANATTSPDGTVDADKLVEDTATSNHQASQSPSVTTARHTFSLYAKAAERSWIRVVCVDGGAYINLTNGTVGGVAAGTVLFSASTPVNVGNGWYRIEVGFTPVSAGAASCTVRLATGDGVQSYLGDGTSGIFIWGAQLEAGAFATSYIPTVASTVTRTADQTSIVAPNFAPWYNQSEGTFVFEGTVLGATGFSWPLIASDNTAPNRFGMYRSSSSVAGFIIASNVTQMEITSSPVVANVPFKIAVAAQTNNGNFSFNGNIGSTDTTITMPVVNKISLGSSASGVAEYLNGHIRSIRYYPVRLSNAQLQALTA